MNSNISEFRSDNIPKEFQPFAKLPFAIKWLAAVYAAGHDLDRAAHLIGEDPALMREFNQTFHGWLGKVSQLYPREVQEQYEKMAKRAGLR